MITTTLNRVPVANPIVMWELTRACSLHCGNCTIGATERRGKDELSTYEAYKTIDQIASLSPRELVITGGDPLERDDVGQIISYARRRGLDPTLVVSPTPLLTFDAIVRLERSGLSRMVFSIDGSSAEIHHPIHGTIDTFAVTLRAMRWAAEAGLDIEVNTLITRRNAGNLDAIADLINSVGICRWNLYFLVPSGPSQAGMLTAGETERLFGVIDAIRERETFDVRVVEAPHFRRYRLQRSREARIDVLLDARVDASVDASVDNATTPQFSDFSGYEAHACTQQDLMDSAVHGAGGLIFISQAGDVRASEFLPVSAGNVRYRPLAAIYQSSDLFVALRDPRNMTGRCGRCEFRHICGGSRARAWATEGDIFADDPLCAYKPGVAMQLPITTFCQMEASS